MIDITEKDCVRNHLFFPYSSHMISLKDIDAYFNSVFYRPSISSSHLESYSIHNFERLRKLEQFLDDNRSQTILDMVFDEYGVPFAKFETKIEILRTRVQETSPEDVFIGICFRRLSKIGNIYYPMSV